MTARSWGLIAVVAGAVASCSSGGSSPSGTGGGAGTASGGSGAGAGTAGTSGGGTTGNAGTSGGFLNPASCGERGTATASTTAYDGTAEFYIIGDMGLGDDVCVVRFDVKRTGAAPANCSDPTTGSACSWSHQVTFSNPTIVTNTNGACDASDSVPALDAAGIAKINGMMVGRGFSRVAGHGDSLMKYDGSKWTVVGRASWSEASSAFDYNVITGACNYGR
jgi:hypothetical protein